MLYNYILVSGLGYQMSLAGVGPGLVFVLRKGLCVMMFNTLSHEVVSVLNRMHESPDCDKYLTLQFISDNRKN